MAAVETSVVSTFPSGQSGCQHAWGRRRARAHDRPTQADTYGSLGTRLPRRGGIPAPPLLLPLWTVGSSSDWPRLRLPFGSVSRPRAYLLAIYSVDQDEQDYQHTAWSRGRRRRPADEWRWLKYARGEVPTAL